MTRKTNTGGIDLNKNKQPDFYNGFFFITCGREKKTEKLGVNVGAIVTRIVLKAKKDPRIPPTPVAVQEAENPVPAASPVRAAAQAAVLICTVTRLRLWHTRCCLPKL